MKKQKRVTIFLSALAFLIALGLTLYPLISNYVNQKYASQIHTAYQEVMEQTDDAALERAKELAIAYNASITPGAAQGGFTEEGLATASVDYEGQLNIAGDGIMGYVEIPKIQVLLPIYHGTEGQTLERGVGHLLGSSLPVGGESTHTILSGHSGMASQRMFTDLEQLREGNVFYLRVLDEVLAYRVDAIHTVLPHDTTYLGIVPGQDLCTLVTCTPTGINTHRLLVQGSRIPFVPAAETQESALPYEENTVSHWEDQYWLGIRLGLVAMVFLTLMVNVLLYIYIRKNRGRAARRKGGRYVRK